MREGGQSQLPFTAGSGCWRTQEVQVLLCCAGGGGRMSAHVNRERAAPAPAGSSSSAESLLVTATGGEPSRAPSSAHRSSLFLSLPLLKSTPPSVSARGGDGGRSKRGDETVTAELEGRWRRQFPSTDQPCGPFHMAPEIPEWQRGRTCSSGRRQARHGHPIVLAVRRDRPDRGVLSCDGKVHCGGPRTGSRRAGRSSLCSSPCRFGVRRNSGGGRPTAGQRRGAAVEAPPPPQYLSIIRELD